MSSIGVSRGWSGGRRYCPRSMAVVASFASEVDEPARTPDAGHDDGRRRPVQGGWLLAALAALTVMLGAAIPFAPVIADEPVVTWPKAGQLASSTALPLAPYRPLAMAAQVPCDALRGGGD